MRPVLILAAALVTLLAACGGAGTGDRADTSGPPAVVASSYPVFDVARAIAGPAASVTNLASAGGEPHDLELTTKQVDAVLDARLLLYFGNGFQPAVEQLAERKGRGAVDLLRGVEGVEPDDPHVWLDPVLMREVAEKVRDSLSSVVPPADRSGITERATDYLASLGGLDQEYRAGLARCRTRVLVTAHDAFSYLARRYSLRVLALTGVDPEAEPDARALARLADDARREGATTVFSEPLLAPEVAEVIGREAGLRVDVLDPIEAIAPERLRAGEDHFAVMRRNLATLRTALECR